jgi:predicted Zn-dependent protease
MQKYLGGAQLTLKVSISPLVSADVELSSVGAALVLAELYQEVGRREEAIGLMQQLCEEEPDNVALKLSLCDLLWEDGDDAEIVEMGKDVANESDVALGVLLFKAKALARMNMDTGAIATLNVCISRSARDPELLKDGRYTRAELYERMGKVPQARKDWERLYADDPHYRDVAAKVKLLA